MPWARDPGIDRLFIAVPELAYDTNFVRALYKQSYITESQYIRINSVVRNSKRADKALAKMRGKTLIQRLVIVGNEIITVETVNFLRAFNLISEPQGHALRIALKALKVGVQGGMPTSPEMIFSRIYKVFGSTMSFETIDLLRSMGIIDPRTAERVRGMLLAKNVIQDSIVRANRARTLTQALMIVGNTIIDKDTIRALVLTGVLTPKDAALYNGLIDVSKSYYQVFQGARKAEGLAARMRMALAGMLNQEMTKFLIQQGYIKPQYRLFLHAAEVVSRNVYERQMEGLMLRRFRVMPGVPPIRTFAEATRKSDRAVLRLLARAAREAGQIAGGMEISGATEAVGAQYRAAQYQQVRPKLYQTMAQLWDGLGYLSIFGESDAAEAAAESMAALQSGLLQQLPEGYEKSLQWQAKAGVDSFISRQENLHKLSRLVYKNQYLYTGLLDKRINMSLLQGKSASEIAKDVRKYIDPDVPGGVSYAAKRLARTEINNAFHFSAIRHTRELPWVQGYQWNLSGSHGRPDVCDEMANNDSYNMGPGVFPKKEVPGKPHPQCLCYITPVLPDKDAFLRSYNAGNYDAYMAQMRAGYAYDDNIGNARSFRDYMTHKSAAYMGSAAATYLIKNPDIIFRGITEGGNLLGRMTAWGAKSPIVEEAADVAKAVDSAIPTAALADDVIVAGATAPVDLTAFRTLTGSIGDELDLEEPGAYWYEEDGLIPDTPGTDAAAAYNSMHETYFGANGYIPLNRIARQYPDNVARTAEMERVVGPDFMTALRANDQDAIYKIEMDNFNLWDGIDVPYEEQEAELLRGTLGSMQKQRIALAEYYNEVPPMPFQTFDDVQVFMDKAYSPLGDNIQAFRVTGDDWLGGLPEGGDAALWKGRIFSDAAPVATEAIPDWYDDPTQWQGNVRARLFVPEGTPVQVGTNYVDELSLGRGQQYQILDVKPSTIGGTIEYDVDVLVLGPDGSLAAGPADLSLTNPLAKPNWQVDTSGVADVYRPPMPDASVEEMFAAYPRLETSPMEVLTETNPRYAEGLAYQMNCFNACTAYELRSRGIGVQAAPATMDQIEGGGMGMDEIASNWMGQDGYEPVWDFPGSAEVAIAEMPVGSRAIVGVTWRQTGGGHVMMAENLGEEGVRFLDPQDGTIWQADALNAETFSGLTRIMRTDDLVPTSAALDRVVGGRTISSSYASNWGSWDPGDFSALGGLGLKAEELAGIEAAHDVVVPSRLRQLANNDKFMSAALYGGMGAAAVGLVYAPLIKASIKERWEDRALGELLTDRKVQQLLAVTKGSKDAEAAKTLYTSFAYEEMNMNLRNTAGDLDLYDGLFELPPNSSVDEIFEFSGMEKSDFLAAAWDPMNENANPVLNYALAERVMNGRASSTIAAHSDYIRYMDTQYKTLDFDTSLYRATNAEWFGTDQMGYGAVGATFTDHAYTSTLLGREYWSPDYAKNVSAGELNFGNIRTTIAVPAGTGLMSGIEMPGFREIVVGRGTTYKITNVQKIMDDPMFEWDVELMALLA